MSEPDYPQDQVKGTTGPLGQRRFGRYLTELPLVVSLGERPVEGYCNQIAEGGLGALLAEPIPAGSMVLLRFTVPVRPTELQVRAAVRCRIGFHHGFEFLSLTEPERVAIRQSCSQLPSVKE